MRKLASVAMWILRAFATAILNFSLLPMCVAVVERRWITGSGLGRKPGDDIDSEVDSFARRGEVSQGKLQA